MRIILLTNITFIDFRKFTLGGAYRKILQVPLDLSWKVIHYNEKDEDLVISDIDRLRKVKPKEETAGMYIVI